MAKEKKEFSAKKEEEIMKKLGERIRAIRLSKGYTSHETFAYENDINRVQYSRYERGEDLRFTTLLRILHAFDMSLEEFFGEGF